MKFAVVVAICALIVVVRAADEFSPQFREKLIQKTQEIGMKCAEKENSNGDDIGELMDRKEPTRREGKCLISCVFQGFGTQDVSGKFTKASMEKGLEPFKTENEGIYNKIIKMLTDCLPEVQSNDRCEAAAQMARCSNIKAPAAGLTTDLIL